MNSSEAKILAATRHWLTRAVIGLNLCPFAKSVHVKGQVRYAVSQASGLEDAFADLKTELRALAEADPEAIDTTLVIFSLAFVEFAEFSDAIHFADQLLRQLRLDGMLQIASFHPHYQFDGSEPEDIENYTNRAPYPIRSCTCCARPASIARSRRFRTRPRSTSATRPRCGGSTTRAGGNG